MRVAASPDLLDRYIRDVIPQKGKWARDQAKQLACWRAELGARTLVTPAGSPRAAKLARDVTMRGGQRSPSTVARYPAVAVKEWVWLEDSPLRKVTKPKGAEGPGEVSRGRRARQITSEPSL